MWRKSFAKEQETGDGACFFNATVSGLLRLGINPLLDTRPNHPSLEEMRYRRENRLYEGNMGEQTGVQNYRNIVNLFRQRLKAYLEREGTTYMTSGVYQIDVQRAEPIGTLVQMLIDKLSVKFNEEAWLVREGWGCLRMAGLVISFLFNVPIYQYSNGMWSRTVKEKRGDVAYWKVEPMKKEKREEIQVDSRSIFVIHASLHFTTMVPIVDEPTVFYAKIKKNKGSGTSKNNTIDLVSDSDDEDNRAKKKQRMEKLLESLKF